jgi:hypothetical protein
MLGYLLEHWIATGLLIYCIVTVGPVVGSMAWLGIQTAFYGWWMVIAAVAGAPGPWG